MSAPGPILTERDTQVLLNMYKYRYLSVTQIQKLLFPSLQTTYRRLRALTQLGYVKGFITPNVPEHIYYLGQAGAEIVAGMLQVDMTDLKWHHSKRTPKDYLFLQHFMNINDFRIALSQACANSTLQLLGFIPESYGEKTSQGDLKKYIKEVVADIKEPATTISHTPDAAFALIKNQSAALFFLEIDRGTEKISDEKTGVLKAIKFYLNYLISEQYQRYQEDFACAPFKGFRALIVTTSQVRIDNIRKVISQFDFSHKAKKFIWLTDHNQITNATIFQPIWRTAEIDDPNWYGIG